MIAEKTSLCRRRDRWRRDAAHRDEQHELLDFVRSTCTRPSKLTAYHEEGIFDGLVLRLQALRPRRRATSDRPNARWRSGARRPCRLASHHRRPHHRQHLLGQSMVRQPGVVQRLRQPPAARPHLRPQRLGRAPGNSAGQDQAMVSGSELYTVEITITALSESQWNSLKTQCAGQIGSLVELLQGRLSKSVMDLVTRHDKGLFPKPAEIKMKCSCPDWAGMCKHVAAVMYGVVRAPGREAGAALRAPQGRSPGADRGRR